MDRTRVLFMCTGNTARSQMAEAFLRAYAGNRYEAYSAGLEPREVNPLTIAVMEEQGFEELMVSESDILDGLAASLR